MATTTSTKSSPLVDALTGYMSNTANAKAIEALDEAYAKGTKATRAAQYAANGLLTARKGKGFGRAALAKALGVPEKAVWHAEYYLPAKGQATVAWSKAIQALPAVVKATPKPPVKGKDAKGSKPAPAKADAADLL